VWVVKNTGCDVIVDDDEDAAMVVEVEQKKIVYLIIKLQTTRGSGLFTNGVSFTGISYLSFVFQHIVSPTPCELKFGSVVLVYVLFFFNAP
jgi:hypothetical protein